MIHNARINYKNLDREIETKAFKKGGKGISHPRINYKNLDREIETLAINISEIARNPLYQL